MENPGSQSLGFRGLNLLAEWRYSAADWLTGKGQALPSHLLFFNALKPA